MFVVGCIHFNASIRNEPYAHINVPVTINETPNTSPGIMLARGGGFIFGFIFYDKNRSVPLFPAVSQYSVAPDSITYVIEINNIYTVLKRETCHS